MAQTNLYGFDLNGNQITFTNSLGRVTANVYDALNRQVEVLYADGTKTLTGYDADGRKVASTNQDSVVTRFAYDGMGRLIAVTDALSNVTSYAYDQAANQTNQIDALGRQTQFAYDGLGRCISRTLPGGQVETIAYDLVGNEIRHTNFNSVVITNQYDALNRLTNRGSANGYLISFSYTATGQRASMTDMSSTNFYLYDVRDRLTNKMVSWLNGPTLTLNYQYDLNGNVTNLWSGSSGGAKAAYQYDALNRLTDAANSAASYGYDGIGNLQSVREFNALTNLYQYDVQNRLTNLVWGWAGTAHHGPYTIASFYYQLGATGNRTNLVEMLTSPSSTNNYTYKWSYDTLYRLTNENISAGAFSYKYAYDSVGNRTNRTASGGGLTNQSFSFNSNDWVNTDTYDSNGNTVTNGSHQPYYYDPENHVTNFNNSVYLGYNGDGLRLVKTASGTTTFYLVDDRNPTGYPQVLEEWTATGGFTNLSKTYTYGLSLLTDNVGYYYGQDGHGSTRFLISALGTVQENFTYDAYGNLINSYGSSTTTRLYCGEELDSNLGFYCLRARYMNPNTGRFWTMDTYDGDQEDPLSLHKYLYCASSPADNVDLTGNFVTGSPLEQETVVADGEYMDFSASCVDSIAEEEVENSISSSVLTATLLLSSALFLTGDEATPQMEPVPQIPDQTQYKAYQSTNLDFQAQDKCYQYALKVKRKIGTKGRPLYIAYRLRYPPYNLNDYAPWGYILDRITGRNISKNGFHVGWVNNGLVFDNWYSGLPILAWPSLYEVMDPNNKDLNHPQFATFMGATIEGYGQLKLFKDRPPTSRYDARWGSEGSDVINLPTITSQ